MIILGIKHLFFTLTPFSCCFFFFDSFFQFWPTRNKPWTSFTFWLSSEVRWCEPFLTVRVWTLLNSCWVFAEFYAAYSLDLKPTYFDQFVHVSRSLAYMWTVDFLGALAFLSIRGVYVIKRPLYPANWSLATENWKTGPKANTGRKAGSDCLSGCLHGLGLRYCQGKYIQNLFR